MTFLNRIRANIEAASIDRARKAMSDAGRALDAYGIEASLAARKAARPARSAAGKLGHARKRGAA